MNLRPYIVLTIMLFASPANSILQAQSIIPYSHYYLNPSLYNPAYTGVSGHNEVFLNFRKQWAGFDGAPTTATFNLHMPLNYRTSIGITAFQDQIGIIRTTSGMATFAHQVYFGQLVEDIHKLSFGISAGIANSFLKDPDNPDDPAIPNNTTYFVNGQFGLYYQLKNFNVSFAIPTLFKTYVVSDLSFNKPGFEAFNNSVSSMSYLFNFTNISFEPFLIYRTSDITKQIEAMGIVKLKNIVWLGGSFRGDLGYSAFAGFQLAEQFKFGYAYEFYSSGIAGFNNGSHEIQIAFRIGKKQIKRTATEELTQTEPLVTEAKEEPKHEEPLTLLDTPVKPAEPIVENNPEVEIAESQPDPEPHKLDGEKLASGHYVVVGVFKFITNALTFKNQLTMANYPAELAFIPAEDYYIVYLGMNTDLGKARLLRDKYRQQSSYSLRETWILSIK